MGLFDSVKKMFSNPPERSAVPEPEEYESVSVDESSDDEAEEFDLAGFDPENEEAFYAAMTQIDSDGVMGGTPQARAATLKRYGIRDELHWQTVRDSMYQVLGQRFGSVTEAFQRYSNWKSGQAQQMMTGNVAVKAASGELNPVEGVSLETWAALNAAIAAGANFEDLLKGANIEQGRWERARDEWNARMSRDTSFAIATLYGNAFQAASQGKYGHLAREANAARAANTDLTSPLPMSMEQYMEVTFEQDYAVMAGKNPTDALKSYGLTLVDFCDLSVFMGYYANRTGVVKFAEHHDAMQRAEAKIKAKYPGVKHPSS